MTKDNNIASVLLKVNQIITKKEFASAFKRVIDILLRNQQMLAENLQNLTRKHNELVRELQMKHDQSLSELKLKTNQLFVKDRLDEIENKTKSSFDKLTEFVNKTLIEKSQEINRRISKLNESEKSAIKNIEDFIKKTNLLLENKIKEMESHKLMKEELVKELHNEVRAIKDRLSNIPRGRNMGRVKVPIVRAVNLTSQVDGATTSFNLPPDTVRVLGVWSTQFPITFDADNDFSFDGKKLTIKTGTIQSGQTLWALCEVLFYP